MTRWFTSYLRIGLFFLALSVFGGCSSVPSLSQLNPFKEEEKKLPGERLAVMSVKDAPKIDTTAAKAPILLPKPSANQAWTQPGGKPNNAPGHLALSGGLKTVWGVSAGEGSSSDGQLTASPIVYQGKIFTLDTHGQVRAFSASGGKKVWQANMTPENEDEEEGFGGGLAIDNGRLYVATGYGTVAALNPATGKQIWSKALRVPIRNSPTAAGDKLYVVTTEGRFYCLAGPDGVELWTSRGLPENATLLSNASPAVSGDYVIVPYSVGEVVAFQASSGKSVWSETLTRRRRGSSISALSSPARPVVSNGVVYTVSHSGRMLATARNTGERLWTQNIASSQTPWVAGDSIFIVDVNSRLIALTSKTGKIRWVSELPKAKNWSGPVLAGGKLWLVSSAGQMVGADAKTGQVITKRNLDTPVYISPVVANGRMYVYTDKARLIALN